MTSSMPAKPAAPAPIETVLELLGVHHASFFAAARYAETTAHPVPCDTRAWSQILVSHLTGLKGIARKKGADLEDGSDVKAANVWLAIDTPRFNGVLKSGRKGEQGSISTLDDMPLLFFVMWDYSPSTKRERCRVWVVRTGKDNVFRSICEKWYEQRDAGVIKSDNFQLHPPRNLDSDVFRNNCGCLRYPLLFQAEWDGASSYKLVAFNPQVLKNGQCAVEK